MNKILQLIIDDFQKHKPSAVCTLALTKFCAAEKRFMDSLNDEQKKEYLALGHIATELDVAEQNEFAEYLFNAIRDNL